MSILMWVVFFQAFLAIPMRYNKPLHMIFGVLAHIGGCWHCQIQIKRCDPGMILAKTLMNLFYLCCLGMLVTAIMVQFDVDIGMWYFGFQIMGASLMVWFSPAIIFHPKCKHIH